MKKVLATLLTISVIFCVLGIPDSSCRASESEFSLIEYLETHDINSYSEFREVIESNCPYSKTEDGIDSDDITYFSIEIDYEDMTVSVTTMGDASLDRSQEASNSASKTYYASNGLPIFTIHVDGSFIYMAGSCNATSASGSFNRAALSTWTSNPTISSGNITASKAYVRIYGIASSNGQSKSYTLTLTCDSTGHFTSY